MKYHSVSRGLSTSMIAVALLLHTSFALSLAAEPPGQPAAQQTATPKSADASDSTITYKNTKYGFNFVLPASWKGYTIIVAEWSGNHPNDASAPLEHGPKISIRHPLWTEATPRQDIPIMVFTRAQWHEVAQGNLIVSAAGFDPGELGRNHKYVFALPPRYDYAFPEGFEEVEKIIASHPLHGF